MNRKLGISIYPEHSTKTQDIDYLTKAAQYGFKRVFTCLLSVQRPKEEIFKDFKEIIDHAKNLNMEVILDIAPAVFDQLGIGYDDLSFFAELGAHGLRLDVGFDGLQEAKMTHNPYGLKIELNMSNDVDYLENILSHQPVKENLLGCHNFYPQIYTGLPYEFFIKCSRRFKKNGIRTAAFISSNQGNIGPWDINDGLCTLEQHRSLPVDVQAKHLWATGVIDDVIIGNAYASEEELKALGVLDPYKLQLNVITELEITGLERKVISYPNHLRRGDITEYMIRSVDVRKKYKNESFPPRSSSLQTRGQIYVGNDLFGKYKGELQVILKEMPLDKRKNLVAKVVEEETFLLDYIGPWTTFELKERK